MYIHTIYIYHNDTYIYTRIDVIHSPEADEYNRSVSVFVSSHLSGTCIKPTLENLGLCINGI